MLAAALPVHAQQAVSFKTSDGWAIHADVYGSGPRGVVLGDRLMREIRRFLEAT
jgi:hypothetical protein